MKDKVVWVTGASTGIGKAVAEKFSKEGAIVAVTARRKSRLVRITGEIKYAGREASAFVCNVMSERSVLLTAKRIRERYGTIDILINNAGATVFKAFLDTKTSDYSNVIDTNLKGPFLCMKAVLPQMIKKKNGTIINILSVAANTAFENSAVYAASKAGLLAMSNCLRTEVRRYGIRITNILPGAVDTAMWESKARNRYRHRMMTPSDIADITYEACNKPKRVVIEDLVVRPIKGDI